MTNRQKTTREELRWQALTALGILFFATTVVAQEQPPIIEDSAQLVGKKVNVQRLPLCQPGTYKADLSHAGQQATVLSAKPSASPRMSQAILDRLTPGMRAMMLDQQKAALLLLQFEDGTKLDTCAPIGPSKLSEYLEIVPGQTLEPVVQTKPAASSAVTPTQPSTQPTDALPDDEVKLALSGKGREDAVWIEDMGVMAAQGNQAPAIALYMPEALLAMRSESAKKQFILYEPSAEDKRRSLTIVARGYAGKTITEGCTSITRVVLLSDSSGAIVAEAYLTEPLAESWQNNFGATNHCQALQAKFSLDDVHKVKVAAPNGEFFVAVFAGTVNTKTYKIKKKHQSKLGLE